MKRFISSMLVVIILSMILCPEIVYSDELDTELIENSADELINVDILDLYIQALTDNQWKVIASSAGSAGYLNDIYYDWPVIHLPHEGISLYKNAVGQIYIVFETLISHTVFTYVAEIIFSKDMESFILYSDQFALKYKIVEE